MCVWCENGRLVRFVGGGLAPLVRKDYSEWLHEPEDAPFWWAYHNERARRLLRIEKKRAPEEVFAESLDDYLAIKRAQKEARVMQCSVEEELSCLNPECERPITRNAALRSGFCSSCYQRTKRWEKKKRLVEARGGKCERCGVEPEYVAVFDFHHRRPDEKSFNIGEGINKSQDVLMEEIEKCELLCANCHREEEHGFQEEVYRLFQDRMGPHGGT